MSLIQFNSKQRRYYAALINGKTNIYNGYWDDIKHKILGKSGARYKGFDSEHEAKQWLDVITTKQYNEREHDEKNYIENAEQYYTSNDSGKHESSQFANEISVYTDGSYFKKTDSAGWGFVVTHNGREYFKLNGKVHGLQTNNRAELLAILNAIKCVAPNNPKFKILTDSKYAMNCVTLWNKTWRKNNWMTSNNTPVKNRELVLEISNMLTKYPNIYIEHIYSHTNNYFNDMADQLAKDAAMK